MTDRDYGSELLPLLPMPPTINDLSSVEKAQETRDGLGTLIPAAAISKRSTAEPFEAPARGAWEPEHRVGWLANIPWKVVGVLYRSRWLAERLFGVRLRPAGIDDHYFDVTTWLLVRRALREIEPGTLLVDLDTGSQAIIGLALWKATGCSVTAVDVDPELVELAQASIDHNEAPSAPSSRPSSTSSTRHSTS